MTGARYRHGAALYDLVSAEHVYRSGRMPAVAGLGLRPGQRVLDIGCGTGLNHALLLDGVGPTGLVVGVDLSAEMLAQARSRAERRGWDNLLLVEADATSLDLTDLLARSGGPFDAALATYALSLMPRWGSAWEVMWDSTVAGGRLAVADMALPVGRARAWAWLARAACALGGADVHAHPWTGLERDCEQVEGHRAWGGHVQVRVGSRPPASQVG